MTGTRDNGSIRQYPSIVNPLGTGPLPAVVALLAVSALPAPLADTASSQPNILFILIDDLGWMDLHGQGNPHLVTPNIDRLEGQGMRFTDAYAWAPACSPTRAAIRMGDYELIRFFFDDSVELYDLELDIGEAHDSAETRPERAAVMRGRLDTWLVDSGASLPRER